MNHRSDMNDKTSKGDRFDCLLLAGLFSTIRNRPKHPQMIWTIRTIRRLTRNEDEYATIQSVNASFYCLTRSKFSFLYFLKTKVFDNSNQAAQKPRNATKKGPAKKRKEADNERKDSDNLEYLSLSHFDDNIKPGDLYQAFESNFFLLEIFHEQKTEPT
jgi:hypothetical protein